MLTRQRSYGTYTNRSAEKLAEIYGCATPDELIEGLPYEANVLDAGAGLSDLGHKVARARDDVHWVNIDVIYKEGWRQTEGNDTLQLLLQRFRSTQPDNLTLIDADVDQLPDLFPEGHFDRTFSYWMLPYMFMGGAYDRGQKTVYDMLRLTRAAGAVSLGPLARSVDKEVAQRISAETEDRINFTLPEDLTLGATLTAESPQDEETAIELAQIISGTFGRDTRLVI